MLGEFQSETCNIMNPYRSKILHLLALFDSSAYFYLHNRQSSPVAPSRTSFRCGVIQQARVAAPRSGCPVYPFEIVIVLSL